MELNMNILYVGPAKMEGTAGQRLEALVKIGQNISALDANPPRPTGLVRRALDRARKRLFYDWSDPEINNRLIKYCSENTHINVLWLDRAMGIRANTYKKIRTLIPNVFVVHYFPDDFLTPLAKSRHVLKSMPEYDLFLTNRKPNVKEALDAGARDSVQVLKSFHPTFHRPLSLTDKERKKFGGEVGFVGTFERERGNSIKFLCNNGVRVKVWGNGWRGFESRCAGNLTVAGDHIMGQDYVRALNSFDICLCFLRKICRDEHTSRTFEIPGCRSFMLAERTSEHKMLFEEGIEAEYFDSDEELLEKVNRYLPDSEARERIASAGHHRAMTSGYTTFDRMGELVDLVRNKMQQSQSMHNISV